MQSKETVSHISRTKKAVLLGEEFHEKSNMLSEYYSCLMEKCDPVQQAVIHNLREVVEKYEECVAKIRINGFSIQECIDAYSEYTIADEALSSK